MEEDLLHSSPYYHAAAVRTLTDGQSSLVGPRLWRVLRHVNVAQHPLAALDTLVSDLPAHPDDIDLLHVAVDVIEGWALWGDRTDVLLTMLTHAAVKAVLRNLTKDTFVHSEVHDLTMSLALAYRMWTYSSFRMGGGIAGLLKWGLLRYDDTVRAVLLACAHAHPDYLLHDPALHFFLGSQIHGGVFEVSEALIATQPVAFLVCVARSVSSERVLDVVLRRTFSSVSQVSRDALLRAWPERFGRTPPSPLPSAPECPITLQACADPVVASDGFTYERSAILQVLTTPNARSPMTREILDVRVR